MLTVDRVVDVGGYWTLLEVVVVDNLASGDVGDGFPRIRRGHVPVPSYAVAIFAEFGVFMITGWIDSV